MTSEYELPADQSATSGEPLTKGRVDWRQVALFVGITYLLTLLLNLAVYLAVKNQENSGITLLLQLQMLIPATVAIVLQMFVFKGSSIYHLRTAPRWFFYFFLFYALLYVLVAIVLVLVPDQGILALGSVVIQLLTIVGLLLTVILRLVSGKEKFRQAGLSGGKLWYYVTFGLFFLVFYGLMSALSVAFDLSLPADVRLLVEGSPLAELPYAALVGIMALQMVIIGPILGLLIAFGEEYGWRGYLQGELIKMGKVRGVLLVGVIWGIWHAPIIAMGHNYPGHPVWGPILFIGCTIWLGFVLGLAVLRSGSVWLAAFLHALNNQFLSFLMIAFYMPKDTFFSFEMGIYALPIWAIGVTAIVLLWRREWLAPAIPPVMAPATSAVDPAAITDGQESGA